MIRSGPHLVFNGGVTHSGGQVCIDDSNSTGDPLVDVNSTWTMSGTANIACAGNLDGRRAPRQLARTACCQASSAGAEAIATPTLNAGTITVANGQQFDFGTGSRRPRARQRWPPADDHRPVALQGGTLKGGGTAGDRSTTAAARVAPGASPGKLTVNGDYTQGAGGTLQVEIDGTTQDTQYDHLAVTGNASLGGTLAIVNNPRFTPQQSELRHRHRNRDRQRDVRDGHRRSRRRGHLHARSTRAARPARSRSR